MALPVWRELGRAEDLDLDFEHTSRAVTVSRLLAQCRPETLPGAAAGDAWAWQLTLGYRIGAVAAIVAATLDRAELDVTLHCLAESCQQPFEVSLPLATLRELGEAAQQQATLELTFEQRSPLRVRRPTGEDVRRWQAHRYTSVQSAEAVVLESLVETAGPALQAAEVAAIGSALEEADPLPTFAVSCCCPACGVAASYDLDLEAVLCARLAQWQRELIAEVHGLAACYGWTEHDVLRLPRWRRQAYLEQITARRA